MLISINSLQSDIGFGKLQSYVKLEKLGEVCIPVECVLLSFNFYYRALMLLFIKERAGKIGST